MRNLTKKITQLVVFGFRKATWFLPYSEISVLCYHAIDEEDDWDLTISPQDFQNQINFLKKKKYYFCNVEDLIKHINGELILPRKTVHLTFDDGYRSVYQGAFGILEREEIPATVFLMGDFDQSVKNRGTDRHGLFSNEIANMKQSGLITFGYHSKDHKMLDQLSGDDIVDEVKNDFDYKYFAYPGGHHSEEAQKVLRQVGYDAAFSISPGLIKEDDSLFLIKRNVILREMSLVDLYIRVTHVVDWYKVLAKFFKKN